jgi:hypothetical protein
VKIVDVNVLVHAVNTASRHHDVAQRWLVLLSSLVKSTVRQNVPSPCHPCHTSPAHSTVMCSIL